MVTTVKIPTILLGAICLLMAITDASADYRTVRAGGSGGNFKTRICEVGFVLRGLEFKAGSYVMQTRLICQRVSGNSITGQVRILDINNIGEGFFGSREKQVYCPRNHRVSGIKVQAGLYLDRINSIRCTRYKGTAKKFVNVGIGGKGGTTHRLYCDANEDDYLLGFTMSTGRWIDSVKGICR